MKPAIDAAVSRGARRSTAPARYGIRMTCGALYAMSRRDRDDKNRRMRDVRQRFSGLDRSAQDAALEQHERELDECLIARRGHIVG